ncbi:uncharacterized protein [Leptinotarsa decemlineata]|uniref:uncharacterized protein n=1 Tax=Leptinotarsa decemlineata TaxID=7539 RepID=UPI003D30D26F
MSEQGVHQGDPLGPLLFCLSIHHIITKISTEFNGWYLDDGSIGDKANVVLENFRYTISHSKDLGLELNFEKCELIFLDKQDPNIIDQFNLIAPGIRVIEKPNWFLLGVPLSDDALKFCLQEKLQSLRVMSGRLSILPTHVAFHLLKNSLAIPKLSYILRCSPTWHDEQGLQNVDDELRRMLELITNNRIEDETWLQASLPVSRGGLGIRSATSLALPSFLSSFCSVSDLIEIILQYPKPISDCVFDRGKSRWESKTGQTMKIEDMKNQKAWDKPLLDQATSILLKTASDTSKNKARLLAVTVQESGAWLNAVPVASLGTLLDDDSFRLAIGFRLGTPLCVQPICKCGAFVDESGTHGLSCRFSAGRLSRHYAINDLIKRALTSAKIPAILEPIGSSRDDGKRPDGMTLVPWKNGKSVVWDLSRYISNLPSSCYFCESRCCCFFRRKFQTTEISEFGK